MNASRTLFTVASAAALLGATSLTYAQTNDTMRRPSTAASGTMPSDMMPNTSPSAPMNNSTRPYNGTTANTDTGSSRMDSSTRAPVSGTNGNTLPTERRAKLDRG